MTNPGVCSSEVDPLKGGEGDVGEAGISAPTSPLKKGVCGGGLRLSRLSAWRTAAFLLALFLCLTIVFAFSFILPCPIRPQYLVTWNYTLPAAAAYDFLAVEHANKDMVKDIIFIYKSSEGRTNNTCENEGLSSPCIFVLAVDGTDGEYIWELPLNFDLRWAQCGLKGLDGESPGCLLAHTNTLTAISTIGGNVLWQQSSSPGAGAVVPVLSVPDLDKDGTDDIALLTPQQNQMKLVFLSGETGLAIGSEVEVVDEVSSSHMLHNTAKEAQYLLLQTGSGLYAEGLWNLVAKAGLSKQLKKDSKWEKMRNGTGPIMIYHSPSLQQVLRVAVGSEVPSLLLIMGPSTQLDQESNQLEGTVTELLDGDSLSSLWKINSSKLLSQPSFGHFNKDDIPDVVMEEEAGNATKRVVILDGKTGGVLWEVTLLALPHTPAPASVLTIHSYSVFMLWGEKQSNETGFALEKHYSYLLHPSYSNLLLQRSNPVEHIIAFKVTLLERGRHASYLLLTGPHASEGVDPDGAGSVILTKRKLKSDVSVSSVLSVRGPLNEDKVEHVKEAFSRLRFSD
ncbi:protein FAM234A [Clupea harengus]|uniref:Protein FAM234A n=1 Tax=Clupea harengus TaxID=7950 RepID=A0A6P3W2M6_CLUHA|nr:protein FAM234A [Clupea harengus]XP_031417228.1 protein FAM234A [Clupea harengus]XP_031417229.1 protein FAM234A [Clupea harengus]